MVKNDAILGGRNNCWELKFSNCPYSFNYLWRKLEEYVNVKNYNVARLSERNNRERIGVAHIPMQDAVLHITCLQDGSTEIR